MGGHCGFAMQQMSCYTASWDLFSCWQQMPNVITNTHTTSIGTGLGIGSQLGLAPSMIVDSVLFSYNYNLLGGGTAYVCGLLQASRNGLINVSLLQFS